MISDQQIANERNVGAVGVAVVNDVAAAAGVSAIPTPVTEAESDLWFVHKYMFNEFLFGTGVGIHDGAGRIYEIDSRGMRKVNDDQDVIVVAEFDNISASGGFILTLAGRLLIKEH